MDKLLEFAAAFVPLIATAAGVVVFLFACHWALLGRHPEFSSDSW